MKRVLIVEDQEDIRELVRMTLEMEDLQIEEADNGDAALAQAARFKPDLMLLDVMMPGSLDGYQATAKPACKPVLTATSPNPSAPSSCSAWSRACWAEVWQALGLR
jgi:two-component system, OmpR family, phosphate regulon response regulator PhoB